MFLWLSKERRSDIAHWAMELVVVVIGVLLALWAQEWAEDRAEEKRMNVALDAVHAEAYENLVLLMFKQTLDQCLIDREILIRDGLRNPNDAWPGITENAMWYDYAGPLKSVPVRGVMPRQGDSFQTAAFRSALTTGSLTSLDRERFDLLNRLYAMFDQLNVEEDKGDQSIRALGALAHPIRLTPEIRAEMFGALYSADRARFAVQYAWWNDIVSFYRKLGWNDEAKIDQRIKDDKAEELKAGIKWRACRKPHANPFRWTPGA